MRGRYLRRFLGFILAALILPGVVLVLSSSTSQAQHRVMTVRRPIYRPYYRPYYRPWGWRFGYNPYFDYYDRYSQYVFNSSDAAYNQGFRDGLKTGEGDAKHARSYNPERSHYFQEAGFGNFGEAFRSGFLRGYADGYPS